MLPLVISAAFSSTAQMMNEEVEVSGKLQICNYLYQVMLTSAGSTTASSEAVESSIEASGTSAANADEVKVGEEDGVQMKGEQTSEDELERERLMSRAEQVRTHKLPRDLVTLIFKALRPHEQKKLFLIPSLTNIFGPSYALFIGDL